MSTPTISDSFRLLVPRSLSDKKMLHVGRRGTPWTSSTDTHGGMGGEEDGGYRSACGTAWCLPAWGAKQRADRTMCAACAAIVGHDNIPLLG